MNCKVRTHVDCGRHNLQVRLVIAAKPGSVATMKIVVAGASGLIGSALVPALVSAGHEVVRLGRNSGPGLATWDPVAGLLDPAVLAGAGAVINFAGAGIADGRWTARRRAEIMDSRVVTTRLLVQAMEKQPVRPAAFLCASGSGYYGTNVQHPADESAPAGEGFLAGVCQRWEAEARRAVAYGVRVVPLRFGVVLAAGGGALKKLLPVFRSGMGGPVGDGQQWMSWVALDDAVAAIVHVLGDSGIQGAVNVVAPEPVTNKEFSQVLARILGKPAALRVPAAMLRVMLGDMAEETVLASAKVVPGRLLERGFHFRHAVLEDALRHVLAS